ncbi:MAG: HAD-IA family hydrolase, partial [Burkholderiales bacterium]|nr:HAD-IA family hydrolase [Burkholderiales bacterium]
AQSMGLSARAACVVSGDTTPHAKPHPAPLLHAAQLSGVDPARCLYVGDDRRDIEAGRAAGMRTLAVTWGYLGAGEPPAQWGADAVIDAPAAVLGFL